MARDLQAAKEFAGEAVAFLGAGASVPVYPLYAGLVRELLDAAASPLWLAAAGGLRCPQPVCGAGVCC